MNDSPGPEYYEPDDGAFCPFCSGETDDETACAFWTEDVPLVPRPTIGETAWT